MGAAAAHPAPACGALNLGRSGQPGNRSANQFNQGLVSTLEFKGAGCTLVLRSQRGAAALNPFPVVPGARSRLCWGRTGV